MSGARGRKRKGQPKVVGTVVGQVLDELGLDVAAAAWKIGEHWESAVGPEVARHSRPLGLRGKVLEIAVETSVWSHHLQLQRAQILEALRDQLGEEAPRDLRFRVGYTAPS
ncbi:DUF721 domain-containing protein [Myxococcota bacterium]|nr:DUF721 domain-containing protein [Myxococcota bacterium]